MEPAARRQGVRMNLSSYVWGLGAGVPAVFAEYLYRTLPGPWLQYLWLYLPIQALIGYSIYRLVTTPGVTLIDSLVVFAFCTAALRVYVTMGPLHDKVSAGTWAALGLVMLANLVKVYWRT